MNINGRSITYRGRIVYDRKHHAFSQKDAARVLRDALGFGKFYSYDTTVDDYAQYTALTAISFLARYGFLPYSALDWEQQRSNAMEMGRAIATSVADYIGRPEWMVDVAERVAAWVSGLQGYNPYVSVFRLKPFWANAIAETMANTAALSMEEIYGRKKTS